MGRFFDEIAKVVGGGVSRRGALRKIGGALLAAVGLGATARRASAGTPADCNAYCKKYTAASDFLACRTTCLNCASTAQLCGATATTLTCCPTPANSTVGCVQNACAVTACNAGFGNCDGNVSNGCETNINTSVQHCGGCNKPCPNGQTCQNGTCVAVGAQKCSDVAQALCAAKGWVVVSWHTSFPNSPGGSIFCTSDGRGAGADCDTCGTYNQIVWKNTATDACGSNSPLQAGSVYGGHSPCFCGNNLLVCGTWNMQSCTPD